MSHKGISISSTNLLTILIGVNDCSYIQKALQGETASSLRKNIVLNSIHNHIYSNKSEFFHP